LRFVHHRSVPGCSISSITGSDGTNGIPAWGSEYTVQVAEHNTTANLVAFRMGYCSTDSRGGNAAVTDFDYQTGVLIAF
jgi:hypothetical protein